MKIAKITGFLLCLSQLWAQPEIQGEILTEEGLKLQLEKIQEEIKQEKKKWQEEKALSEKEKLRKDGQLKELQKNKMDLEASISGLDQKIEKILNDMQGLKKEEEHLKAKSSNYLPMFTAHADTLKKYIESSLPANHKKRLERINLLLLDFKKEKISPEEAFNRLWGIVTAEAQYASESETYSGQVKSNLGEETPVKYLRIGTLFLMYTNASQSEIGMLRKSYSGDWKWYRNDELSRKEKNEIKGAVDIADGKAVPGFTPVPFFLSQFAREGGS